MPPPSLWYSDSWHVTYSSLLWFIPLSEAKRGHLRNLSDDDGGNIKRVRSFGIRSDPCSPCQWNWKHRNGKYLDYPRHGIVNENFLWKLSIHFQFSYSMKFCSVWKTKSWLSEWKKWKMLKVTSDLFPLFQMFLRNTMCIFEGRFFQTRRYHSSYLLLLKGCDLLSIVNGKRS